MIMNNERKPMKRILIVDDEHDYREMFTEFLSREYICESACNGKKAIQMVTIALRNNNHYKVIVLDYFMPQMNGDSVIEAVRKLEEEYDAKKRCHIIMVTAYESPYMDCFLKGCNEYMNKPVKLTEVYAKINKEINGRVL